ncbi:putative RING-H2 finger protein ATL19, partial [Cucurbita argyrosperma subsp. sororia]
MIPQALTTVPQSNPPPSTLPFLTAFSIVIVIIISIVIFSILASFSIIIFIFVLCQYLIGSTNLDGHHLDVEAGERNQNQNQTMRGRSLVSRYESNIWREALERTMAERKGRRAQIVMKMATRVRYGCSEVAAKYTDCAICLEEFENGEDCQIFVVCKHIFHYSCIQRWLRRNMTCPICRSPIANHNNC